MEGPQRTGEHRSWWAALAVYGLAVPAATVLLHHDARANTAGLLAVSAAIAVHAAVAGLAPSRLPATVSAPVALLLLGAAVVVSGGASSPLTPMLVLPLVFAAAQLPGTRALPTLALFLASYAALIGAGGGSVALVVELAVEVAVAGAAAVWSARSAAARRLDRLRTRVAAARSGAEIEAAFAEDVLGGDIVAAAIAVVDRTPPSLAQIVADVGPNVDPSGPTVRVTPTDTFSLAAYHGPTTVEPDPASPNLGARIAFARGYASALVLPLWTTGSLVGHLVLSSSSSRAAGFSPRRVDALARRYAPLADALAAFLVRRERDARLQAALAVRELTSDLGGATTVDDVLGIGARRLRELLRADLVWLFRPDGEDPGVLHSVATAGEAEPLRFDTTREQTGAATALRSGQVLWEPDPRNSPLPHHAMVDRLGIEAMLFLPLPAAGQARGSVACAWRRPRVLRADEIDLASFVAGELSQAWERIEAQELLREQATRDPLTGLLNHRAFHEEIDRAVAGVARGRGPVALVLADLDHLKHLNDYHGHATGDAALRAAADALRSVARSEDVVGRLGGDEFGWLLVASNPDDALVAARRAVALVAATRVEPVGFLSLSAGVAVAASAIDGSALFERADHALYDAKQAGRGLAVMAGKTRRSRRLTEARPADDDAAAGSAAPEERQSDLVALALDWSTLFRASACGVSLLDGGGETLRDVVLVESGRVAGGRLGEYRVSDVPATASALAENRPYACSVEDPEADGAEVAILRSVGYAAVMVVPLVAAGGPVGVVELFDARPRTFSAAEQRFAVALARYAAASLDPLPA